MEGLFMETNGLVQQIHEGLARLERAPTQETGKQAQHDVAQRLDLIASNCERLDILAGKEPVSKRRSAKYRVDQLKYDSQHLRASLYALEQKLETKWRHNQERNDLLTRRFTPNGIAHRLPNGGLQFQGSNLRGIKRKMLDVSNMLGLSNVTLRLIERRTAQDKVILFGGMIVTSLIMFLLYRWIKG